MNKKLPVLRSLLLVGTFSMMGAIAHANSITLGNVSQALVPGGSTWTYSVDFANSSISTGDYFTINDFGAATVVSGLSTPVPGGAWAMSQALAGPNSLAATDSGSVLNVTFTYTGPAGAVGGVSGDFATTITLGSPLNSLTPAFHDYTSIDKAATGVTAGQTSRVIGPVAGPATVPTTVPDAGSTVGMLGCVLLVFAALRRKLQAA
jgi:hypothetical protein